MITLKKIFLFSTLFLVVPFFLVSPAKTYAQDDKLENVMEKILSEWEKNGFWHRKDRKKKRKVLDLFGEKSALYLLERLPEYSEKRVYLYILDFLRYEIVDNHLKNNHIKEEIHTLFLNLLDDKSKGDYALLSISYFDKSFIKKHNDILAPKTVDYIYKKIATGDSPYTLLEKGGRNNIPILKELLHKLKEYSFIKYYIEPSLALLGEEEYLVKALDEFKSDDPNISLAAWSKLRKIKSPKIVQHIIGFLDDENSFRTFRGGAGSPSLRSKTHNTINLLNWIIENKPEITFTMEELYNRKKKPPLKKKAKKWKSWWRKHHEKYEKLKISTIYWEKAYLKDRKVELRITAEHTPFVEIEPVQVTAVLSNDSKSAIRYSTKKNRLQYASFTVIDKLNTKYLPIKQQKIKPKIKEIKKGESAAFTYNLTKLHNLKKTGKYIIHAEYKVPKDNPEELIPDDLSSNVIDIEAVPFNKHKDKLITSKVIDPKDKAKKQTVYYHAAIHKITHDKEKEKQKRGLLFYYVTQGEDKIKNIIHSIRIAEVKLKTPFEFTRDEKTGISTITYKDILGKKQIIRFDNEGGEVDRK